jgi:hypothetical protein
MHFVLSKPELIELILLQLPMRDLLVHAQLVNKDFYSVIKNFPSLQRKLFFVAKPATSPQKPQDDRGSMLQAVMCHEDWEINPLLRERFPPWFNSHAQLKQLGITELRNLDWNSSTEKIAAYARCEASWRRMLVTQPPITRLGIVNSASSQGGTSQCTGEIVLESGIKMGLLFDLVEMHMISNSPVSSFALRWHVLLDEQETALEPKITEHHITLYTRFVFQCAIGTMGRGFRVIGSTGRSPRSSRGRREPPPIEPWQFHSEGYEHVEIDFQEKVDT